VGRTREKIAEKSSKREREETEKIEKRRGQECRSIGVPEKRKRREEKRRERRSGGR